MSPLTTKQAKPAVHFGGQYRIIDFPLSNCVNSGIDTIGVLTQYEAASLHEHIGEGEPWKLTHSEDGGITLLPAFREGVEEYAGTADAIYKTWHSSTAIRPNTSLSFRETIFTIWTTVTCWISTLVTKRKRRFR
ncbi:hypothetical protein HMSSN139_30430 [Paenibacillus sp. HMSSN-139]|nr:hypothetical protein HMSSN139_30430 [Paenibacillus sp. HMSSN-139]